MGRRDTGPEIRSGCALQNLPAELILIITASLDPVNLMCLSYTCRHFRNSLGFSINETLGDPRDTIRWGERGFIRGAFEAADRTIEIREQRLELLCLLDQDGKLSPTTAICSACATSHEKRWFSAVSLKEANDERECKGYTGKVWICPHQSLTHKQVNSDHYWRPGDIPSRIGSCNACRGISLRSWSSAAEYAILNISAESNLLEHNVEKALQMFDASICPHLRLSDPFVSTLYSCDCACLELDEYRVTCRRCHCRACKLSNQCHSCNTNIFFEIQRSWCGKRILLATVIRHFGGYGPTSPLWLSQIVQPSEFYDLRRGWAESAGMSELVKEQRGECPHLPRDTCCSLRGYR